MIGNLPHDEDRGIAMAELIRSKGVGMPMVKKVKKAKKNSGGKRRPVAKKGKRGRKY